MPWVASIVLALVLGGVVVWNLRPAPVPGPVSRFDYELPEGTDFRNTGRPVLAISPNGEHFVYNAAGGLYLRSIDELEARLIPGTEGSLIDPVFSPDGQELAYNQSRQLLKIAVSGGAPVALAEANANFGISWERDGTILYGSPDGIWRVSENGGEPVHLIATEDGEQVYEPQLLPGGEWVLFTLTRAEGGSRWDEADIVIESLSSGERRVLRQGGSDARYIATGHMVYALGDVLFSLPFDVDSLELSGGPVPIVQGVRRAVGGSNFSGAAFYSFSDSGSLVYVQGSAPTPAENGILTWVDRTGVREELTAPPMSYRGPRLSPDGTRLAVYTTSLEGESDIWIYDLVS